MSQLRSLIATFADALPEANITDASELVDHGEWGEALDLLCTQLYEYDVPVPAAALAAIEECGRRLELPEARWINLRSLVVQG